MAKTEIILECHKCGAGFDVTDMKPDSRFRCENCRAFLKVPRRSRRGLAMGVAVAVVVVVAAVVVIMMSSGTGTEDHTTGRKTATRKKTPKPPAPEKPKVDLVQLEYEDLVVRAGKGRTRDLLRLGRFCRQHEKYAARAEKTFRAVLDRDPENRTALEALNLAYLEGMYVPKVWHENLVESPWYKKAMKVLDREVKNCQDLRDLGLSFAYAPPFALVKVRSDDEVEDGRARRHAAAVLQGLADALQDLVGDDVDCARACEAVIPVFWFESQRAEKVYWESRQATFIEMAKQEVKRNPFWSLCKEKELIQGDSSPMALAAAERLVEAAFASKNPPPTWLVLGLSRHIGRIKMKSLENGLFDVTYGVPDPDTLAAVSRKKNRNTLKRIVTRPREAEDLARQILEFLKQRGLQGNINIGGAARFTTAEEGWALTGFFLDPANPYKERFQDYLQGIQKGITSPRAFNAAFSDPDGETPVDFDALDEAWVAWLKKE